MKTLPLILSLLLVTTSVFAEWKFYDLSKAGEMNYYENSSIARDGDKVKVMHYTNFSQDNELTKLTKMLSARVLYEIDCANETREILEFKAFSKTDLKGDMSDAMNPKPEIENIVPNSIGAVLMELVCKKLNS
jgi:hypothetical protein